MNTTRRLRISLRTLFVLTTVCAVWLGYLSKRAHDQRAAVERIRELGGTVVYDFQFENGEAGGKLLKNPEPPGWPWLRRLIGPEFLQDVVRVQLDETEVNNNDLRLIGELKRVNSLSLNRTSISDGGIEQLGGLKRLRYLGLARTKVTGRGLRTLNHFNKLDTLNLEEAVRVDDNALQHVASIESLNTLALGWTSVTSAGVSQLIALRNLRWLSLRDTRVDDAAIEDLTNMQWLIELDITGSQISGEGLLKIRSNLPSCNVVCNVVDVSGDKVFSDERWWQKLVTRMQALNDESRLKLIDFSDTQMADEHLPALYGLNRVEAIDLRNTNVTQAGVEKLRRSLPDCKCIH